MPVLVYSSGETRLDAQSGVLHIGTGPEATLRLPPDIGVDSMRAVITQSSIYRVYVLVDLVDGAPPLRVNDQPVMRLKALRHRDRIALGSFEMAFWELDIREIQRGSSLEGKVCQVCFGLIVAGEEAVTCPWCESPHHRACWFYLQNCSLEACGYPVRQTMCQILSPPARFEQLPETSPIVREKRFCLANQRRDIASFRPGDQVAYCPGCETPFHAECWLALPRCSRCSYDISALTDRVFKPARKEGGGP